MSKTGAQRMREVLNKTGCYTLTGETSADWELSAMGAGLDGLDGEIAGLLADLFPATAGEDQLDAWEALFRPVPSQAETEARREMAAARLAMRPGQVRAEDYGPLLPAAGLRGQVEESGGGLLIRIGRRMGLPEAEIRRELDLVLPAHLPWTLTEEMDWTALDGWRLPFQLWDSQRLTWQELDGLTLDQLETIGRENGI